MKIQSLQVAMSDPEILEELNENPSTFRFHDPVEVVFAASSGKYVKVLRDPNQPGEKIVTGPMANLLQYLAASINFTYKIVEPADRGAGSKMPNGTWTGVVGQIHTKVADIGLKSLKMTPGRAEIVDYGKAITYINMRILAGKGSPKLNPLGFLYPLSPGVWLALLGALLGIWLTTVMLSNSPRGSRRHTWAGRLLYTYIGVLAQQAMAMRFIRGVEKLLVGSWLSVAMVMAWSYSCNLVSLLATRHIPQPFQTLRDVIDSDVKIIIKQNTAFTHYMDHAESGIFKELSDLRYSGRIEFVSSNTQESIEKVRSGDFVEMTLEIIAHQRISNDFTRTGKCDFYISRESFLPGPTSLIIQPGNPLIKAINYRIQNIVYAGLFERWVEETMPNATSCRNTISKTTDTRPLSIPAVAGIFGIWVLGLTISFVAFCAEVIVARYSQEMLTLS